MRAAIILPSRNKSFPREPFEFLHIRERLVSRYSRLETRYSRLDPRTFRASRLESWGSSFERQLTFERYCKREKFHSLKLSLLTGLHQALQFSLVPTSDITIIIIIISTNIMLLCRLCHSGNVPKHNHKRLYDQRNHNHKKMVDHFLMIMIMSMTMLLFL